MTHLYTYSELMLKTEDELLEIKKEKQKEFNTGQEPKMTLVGDIMSLQLLIMGGHILGTVKIIDGKIPDVDE